MKKLILFLLIISSFLYVNADVYKKAKEDSLNFPKYCFRVEQIVDPITILSLWHTQGVSMGNYAAYSGDADSLGIIYLIGFEGEFTKDFFMRLRMSYFFHSERLIEEEHPGLRFCQPLDNDTTALYIYFKEIGDNEMLAISEELPYKKSSFPEKILLGASIVLLVFLLYFYFVSRSSMDRSSIFKLKKQKS